MARYAEGTTVPVEKTRIEIEETLRRFRADAFVSGYEGRTAFIMFRAKGRQIRLTLEMPDPTDKAFKLTETGHVRTSGSSQDAYETECRRRWRALGLLVKAKVAAIAEGIVTFEEEFLAHVVLPDGLTVGQAIREPLALAYERGEMPKFLPPPKGD
ncbi:MAG: hypothetical protein P4L82_16765 [Ancalomicrobiaceae bacterium]|nr:hypothetical protein [Ancalomicrobiaceae bacterium]